MLNVTLFKINVSRLTAVRDQHREVSRFLFILFFPNLWTSRTSISFPANLLVIAINFERLGNDSIEDGPVNVAIHSKLIMGMLVATHLLTIIIFIQKLIRTFDSFFVFELIIKKEMLREKRIGIYRRLEIQFLKLSPPPIVFSREY